MKPIRKAVIPAAGFGTRFLPATKATPKEMLPIVDKPTIQYIVEEALQSGIEEILIITGHGKRAIEDHFDTNIDLELQLRQQGKDQQITYKGDAHQSFQDPGQLFHVHLPYLLISLRAFAPVPIGRPGAGTAHRSSPFSFF